MEIRPNFGGGSPGFIRGGVSFFLQGGVPDFPKQGRFYPSGPPLARLWGHFKFESNKTTSAKVIGKTRNRAFVVRFNTQCTS